MRMLVAAAAVATLSVNSAAAQERGWLAIGLESARHAFSFSGSADAVNACGMSDCEVVETFTACLAVAYSSETASGRPVWTWTEAATEGDARQGAQTECEAAGGLRCAVENTYCLDGASAAAPQATSPATAEQENIFWQSIVDSTNPAMFEAYIAQFPNGVFRALAEARLAELRASPDPRPGATRSSASGASAAVGRDPAATAPDPASGIPVDQLCTPQSDGVSCWMEVSGRAGCYVWNPNPQPGETVTWTAECARGLVQGTGTLRWVSAGDWQTNNTRMVDGKPDGHAILRDVDGWVSEGPYVNGEPNGYWVIRYADGNVAEGPYVDGQRNGRWVIRWADGTVEEWSYNDGERVQ